MLTLLGDCDQELFESFVLGDGRIEKVWVSDSRPMNDEIFHLIGAGIPIIPARSVEHFECAGRVSVNMTALPILQLSFRDNERKGCWYLGVIEGEMNVLTFLRRLASGRK